MVNEVYTVEYKGFWKDIGTPWDLLTANEFSSQYIEENIIGKIEKNVEIKGSIHLGKFHNKVWNIYRRAYLDRRKLYYWT